MDHESMTSNTFVVAEVSTPIMAHRRKNVIELLRGSEVLHASKGSFLLDSLCDVEGRILGLYFSSSWCPSCKAFTPELRSFYENLRRNQPHLTEKFEIVLVSTDHDEVTFVSAFKEMPWCALPFSDRTKASCLSKCLRVREMPTFILVEAASGKVINRNGRSRVSEDPKGAEFPWLVRSVDDLLNNGTLIETDGKTRDSSTIFGHAIAIYFSANWCPPCKAFTPQLVQTYGQIKANGHKFEVVFVSSDRSQESFQQYFGTMPWLAVPYEDDKRRKEFAELFNIQGIPTLVMLDEKHRILSREGRYEVIEDPEGKRFPWKPLLVEDLTDKFSSKLSEDAVLILFTDGNEKEREQAKQLLFPVAAEHFESADDDRALWFFVGGEEAICDSLRECAQLEDEVPLVAILDLPNGEKFILEDDVELSSDVIRNFVRRYLADELRAQPIRG